MTFLERRFPVLVADETTWEYAHLISAYLAPDHVCLFCGHEPGIACFSAKCERKHLALLAPYLELLEANQADSLAVEAPVVPLTHDALGQWVFSPEGARYDYPDASAPPPPSRGESHLDRFILSWMG